MVFLFGLDVPLVEVMVVLAFLIIVALVVLAFILRGMRQLKKKLDAVLHEERIFKKELDLTKLEEDEQLNLMKTMVAEMSTLHGITTKKGKHLADAKKLLKSFDAKSSTEKQRKDTFKKMMDQLKKLDEIAEKEDLQISYIKNLLGKAKKK